MKLGVRKQEPKTKEQKKRESLNKILKYKEEQKKKKELEKARKAEFEKVRESKRPTLESMIDKRSKNGNKVYSPEYCVLVYECGLNGLSQEDAAELLKMPVLQLRRWLNTHPELRRSFEYGKKVREDRSKERYSDWVYDQLSPECKLLWDKLVQIHEGDGSGSDVELLLKDQGKLIRQKLFLQALISYGFNTSRALRFVNLPKSVYDKWMTIDPEFQKLINEVHWHRKNEVEDAMMDLVKARVPSAVIAMNKGVNADRGYGNKMTVEHTGSVTHNHQVVPVEDLQLPLDVMRTLLDAYRQRQMRLAVESEKAGSSRRLEDSTYLEALGGDRDADGFLVEAAASVVSNEPLTQEGGSENDGGG